MNFGILTGERIKDLSQYLQIEGCGDDLIELSNYICEKFPLLNDGKTWVKAVQNISNAFSMKNLDGQMASIETASRMGFTNIEALIEKEEIDYIQH